MRHTITPILIVLVALSTVGQGDVVAQSSSAAASVVRLSLAGPATHSLSKSLNIKRKYSKVPAISVPGIRTLG